MADNETEPRTVLIAKEMQSAEMTKLTKLIRQYKYVFARSFEDMKGLDPVSISIRLICSKMRS